MDDRYIPLDPNGFQNARKLGYIDQHDPPNGNLCLQCGAIVGSRWVHDVMHSSTDGDED